MTWTFLTLTSNLVCGYWKLRTIEINGNQIEPGVLFVDREQDDVADVTIYWSLWSASSHDS